MFRFHKVCGNANDPKGVRISFDVSESNSTNSVTPPTTSAASVIPQPLSPSIEEQATCFFVQNYIWEDFSSSRGYFHCLPTIYRALPETSAVTHAVVSIGLAGLANTMKSGKVLTKATRRYSLALSSVNAALQDVEKAKEDQTLIAVMLLGLYEVTSVSRS